MARGLVLSDSYDVRVARHLQPLGLDVFTPRPGATIAGIETYLGPERDWDRPVDPFQLDRYEVSSCFKVVANMEHGIICKVPAISQIRLYT